MMGKMRLVGHVWLLMDVCLGGGGVRLDGVPQGHVVRHVVGHVVVRHSSVLHMHRAMGMRLHEGLHRSMLRSVVRWYV